MIDTYPTFSRLAPVHYIEVQDFIRKERAPHSDYNFSGLWSFDLDRVAQVSRLNGNLIILVRESGSTFFSFFGNNYLDETATTLIKSSHIFGCENRLKLVSDSVAGLLDRKKFIISEDRDNFDYIIQVNQLAGCIGKKYQSLRQKKNRLARSLPEIICSILPADGVTKKLIINFYESAISNNPDIYESLLNREKFSTIKFFEISNLIEPYILGFFLKSEMVGFVIVDIISPSFAVLRFLRAHREVSKDLYSYMWHTVATKLSHMQLEYLNLEQDLGSPGLREKKMSLRPAFFYKKYTVELK